MTRRQAILLGLTALILLGVYILLRDNDKPVQYARRTVPVVHTWTVTIGQPELLPGQDVDQAPELISEKEFDVEIK